MPPFGMTEIFIPNGGVAALQPRLTGRRAGSVLQQGVARRPGEGILRLRLSLLRQPRWAGGFLLAWARSPYRAWRATFDAMEPLAAGAHHVAQHGEGAERSAAGVEHPR